MKFEVLKSERVYTGRAFSVRNDRLRMDRGHIASMDIVEHNSSVTILPVDEQERIWFVRQLRYPVGDWILELPAGVIEISEDPLDTAQRELQEEIGVAAESLDLIGEFYLAPGYSTELMYVYLAEGLFTSPLECDLDERIEIVILEKMEAYQMVEDGEIRDAKTIAALYLGRGRLGIV